ncbi:hypothetical protein LJC43_08060, partial [Parabacteroides sp. OttesenSCG-928-G21]|nr:hypothetical protein [Parabacteroides sp. OttesenSCG-928-G21]
MKKIFTLILLLFVVITGTKADEITVKATDENLIETINNAADGSTIYFEAGEYELESTLTISDKSLTIIGAGAANTILVGSWDGIDPSSATRLFYIADATASLSIKGVTLQNGYVTGSGGAIYNLGSLFLTNCVLKGNGVSSSYGGAINNATSSKAVLINCQLTDNKAESLGGAIYNDGDLTIINSTLTGNSVTTYGGGALYAGTTSTTKVLNSIIVGNKVGSDNKDIYIYETPTFHIYHSAYEALENGTLTASSGNLIGASETANILTKVNGYYQANGDALTAGKATAYDGTTGYYYNGTEGAWKTATGGPASPAPEKSSYLTPLNNQIMGSFEGIDTQVTTEEDVVNRYDGVISFREAIANAIITGEPVTFDAVTDGKAIVMKNVTNYRTFALKTNEAVTILGNGADKTIIDGDDKVQIFTLASGASLTVEGVTLQKGNTGYYGGAIYNYGGSVVLTNCQLIDNNANMAGGAIASISPLTLVNCALTGNTTAGSGGAIYAEGTTLIMNTTITGNHATNGGGLGAEGTTTILNSIIVGNTASGEGKDIYNAGSNYSITLAYNAWGDWSGQESYATFGNNYSDLSASEVFADPGVSLALLKDSKVATKGTLVALKNSDNKEAAYKDGTWMKFEGGSAESISAGFEANYTVINNALDTDPASGYPQRNNNEEIYSMGAVLAVA